ncbi:hypothetical protein [Dechloromonas sp. HYN0024]|uniref:hypothetical protein n=1 Tax=Dechloromonas sp. HYN0024 TaxID=2231055 RepID=UPI0013C307CF|nr:hypothetical protein [Dechloromonas sp. HYN0024]
MPRRLMIFDPLKEYGEFGEVVTSLAATYAKAKASTFALVFQPILADQIIKAQFDGFCDIAYEAGNCTVICEELSLVTTPSKAPPAWSKITLTGRHKKMRVFGLSQRPASIDKNFFSNATKVRCGRLNYASDIKVLSNVLGVEPAKVQSLLPLDFIERDMATGKISAGKLIFR